jgi:hypothetical protein
MLIDVIENPVAKFGGIVLSLSARVFINLMETFRKLGFKNIFAV